MMQRQVWGQDRRICSLILGFKGLIFLFCANIVLIARFPLVFTELSFTTAHRQRRRPPWIDRMSASV